MDSATASRVTPLREPLVDTEGLRASTDLVALVGKYSPLRRRGNLYVGLCPFHNEKTPSFYVYPNRRYHCFGCGANGDCISFVRAIDGVDFKEAATRLGAGTITAASYREHIEGRRKEAAVAAANDKAAYPWQYLEAEWLAGQDAAAAEWEAENSRVPTDFEAWLIQCWLRDIRSDEFRGSVQGQRLMAEWERGR